uniref:PGG domain-containing protein n=1 Tax=Tetraselmis chuii TaxID=63592 RepID=A0A7S1T1D2_9CHLO
MVGVVDIEMRNPLHVACMHAHTNGIKEFLDAAMGNPNEPDGRQPNRALLAAFNQGDKHGLTPVHYAARECVAGFRLMLNYIPEQLLRYRHPVTSSSYLCWVAGEGLHAATECLLMLDNLPPHRYSRSPSDDTTAATKTRELHALIDGSLWLEDRRDTLTPIHKAVKSGNVKVVDHLYAYVKWKDSEQDIDADNVRNKRSWNSSIETTSATTTTAPPTTTNRRRLLTIATTLDRDTPLHVAAAASNVAMMEVLLALSRQVTHVSIDAETGRTHRHAADNTLDVDARNSNGNTPLHLLCRSPAATPTAAQVLVRAGCNLQASNGDNQHPFHLAVQSNNVPLVEDGLLSHTHDINCRDMRRRTPLHYLLLSFHAGTPTCESHHESEEKLKEHRRMASLLINQPNVDINAKDADGNTPLHFAVLTGCETVVQQLLRKVGQIDVHVCNLVGQRAIDIAVAEDRVIILKRLIAAKALVSPPRVRAAEATGQMPTPTPDELLMRAFDADHTRVARVLVDDGKISLRGLRQHNGDQRWGGMKMVEKAREGDVTFVRLLLQAGVSPSSSGEGTGSPLLEAANAGQVAVARELISHGALVGGEQHNKQLAQKILQSKLANHGGIGGTGGGDDGVGVPSRPDGHMDAEIVNMLVMGGTRLPETLMRQNKLVIDMLQKMTDKVDSVERMYSELTVTINSLPQQMRAEFQSVHDSINMMSTMMVDLELKKVPRVFVLVPDVTQRFHRLGYDYPGKEDDISRFEGIMTGIAQRRLAVHEWVQSFNWVRAAKTLRGEKMRLKLLCEKCGRPSPDHRGYKIEKPSKDLVKLLPAMQIGFKVLRVVNMATTVASFFAPGFPSIPQSHMKRIEGAIKDIRSKNTRMEFACIEDDDVGDEEQVANSLRQLEEFLARVEPPEKYPGNLNRVVMDEESVLFVCSKCLKTHKRGGKPPNAPVARRARTTTSHSNGGAPPPPPRPRKNRNRQRYRDAKFRPGGNALSESDSDGNYGKNGDGTEVEPGDHPPHVPSSNMESETVAILSNHEFEEDLDAEDGDEGHSDEAGLLEGFLSFFVLCFGGKSKEPRKRMRSNKLVQLTTPKGSPKHPKRAR